MASRFSKMQGAGNDFIVVEGEAEDWAALAPRLCARHFGIGSDGLLVALPSDRADVRMRMYNPDGTEDECGNGLRCLALYAARRGLAPGNRFQVETLSGVKRVEVRSTGGEAQVTAQMGQAELRPERAPVLLAGPDALGYGLEVAGERLEAFTLSTGTTHTVLFEMPDEERFQRLSPLLEHHPLFPERTTVLWTEITGPDEARVRIWERGAGETLACGTGACAVAAAAVLTGRTGREVAVTSRGGTLRVRVAEDLSLTLTGPAAFVFEGVWD